MQADIKDIQFLTQTIKKLSNFIEDTNNLANKKIQEIEKVVNKTQQELKLSNGFLTDAKAFEAQKLAILSKAQAELAKAQRALSAAIASGNPAAIAGAQAYVAKKAYDVGVATKNYNRARKNRVNMTQRVDLAKKANQNANNLLEESKKVFNANLTSIKAQQQQINARLLKAYNTLSEYNLQDLVLDIEIFFKTFGLEDIEKELINDGRADRVNGKIVIKRDKIFNPKQKDGNGRTNIDRMKNGLAPIDKDGKPIELHHLKQKDDGIILEVTNEEHTKHSQVLHRYKNKSEINRKNFTKWKKEHWKKRAEELDNG